MSATPQTCNLSAEFGIGEPVHGLYDPSAGGVIVMENSETVAYGGQSFYGYDASDIHGRHLTLNAGYESDRSDAAKLADTAAGMSWTPAVIYGVQGVYGGVQLGLNTWLYKDEGEKFWAVKIRNLIYNTSCVVEIRSFGVFGETPSLVQTVSLNPAYDLTGEPYLDIFGGGSETISGRLADVNGDGSSALINAEYLYRYTYEEVLLYKKHRTLRGILRVDISGVPPAATVVGSIVFAQYDDYGLDGIIPTTYANDFDRLTNGYVLAACFDSYGSVKTSRVKFGLTSTTLLDGCPAYCDMSFGVYVDGVSSGWFDLPGDINAVSYDANTGMFMTYQTEGYMGPITNRGAIIPWRGSNRAALLQILRYDGTYAMTSTESHCFRVDTPAPDDVISVLSDNVLAPSIYCSINTLTGAMAVRNSPVCFM